MYLLDQHAAHERVLFEKVKANYYKNEEKDVQVLLLPDIMCEVLNTKELFLDILDEIDGQANSRKTRNRK